MKIEVPEKLKKLRENMKVPLYITGGMVRNALLGIEEKAQDFDIAAPMRAEEFLTCARETEGIKVKCIYERTGTARLTDGHNVFEYSAFRKESYGEGGFHTPEKVEFTEDIKEDALRRDFKCNALYYDIQKERIVDPLGGLKDIEDRVLSSVRAGGEVFKEDGLRLLRLCRLYGELDLDVEQETLAGAKRYAGNIADISAERINSELKMMLQSDKKYSVSRKNGHYLCFKLAKETGILDYIMPELTSCDKIEQRKDYHKYDVLEHSFRALLYADPSVRLAALLHDVGKAVCFAKNGNFYGHDRVSAELCDRIMRRLRFSKAEISECVRLIALHMADLKGEDREIKIKRLIVANYDIFDKLMLLKEADFKACKDEEGHCPTVRKWQKIYAEMRKNKTPFTLKELKIGGKELIEAGITGREIGETLEYLLHLCTERPELNQSEKLLSAALKKTGKGGAND